MGAASKILSDAVTQDKAGLWDFRCPGFSDSRCGDGITPFYSTGWPTKKAATERGNDHLNEHKLGEETRSLNDFRADLGIDGPPSNAVAAGGLSAKDL